jgi:four helix bundle protein
VQQYRELKVWQRAYQLVLEVYRVSAVFPGAERFGLTAQLRRAAVSVVANIAEGAKRAGGADYGRFLNIAQGSLAESEALLEIAVGLEFAARSRAEILLAQMDELGGMLFRLRKRVLDGTRA